MTSFNRDRQHTIGHINCNACEESRQMFSAKITGNLLFCEAAEIYMRLRTVDSGPATATARYVRKNTLKAYRRHTTSLALFFEKMQLSDIRWFHMRAYQSARITGSDPFVRKRRPHEEARPCPCKPQQVNQELAFLKMLKKRSNSWTVEDDENFEDLQEEESDIPRSLTPEEQEVWLDVSKSRERWAIVHWYSVVAFDTTMSTNELRGLRLGDVNLTHRLVNVPWPAAKNRFRHREIALDHADVLWAFDQLIRRALDLGASQPNHYLFPFRDTKRNLYLPDRHMTESGIKKLWQEVRDETGLNWFRQYDTRHTGITRLAEAGVPIEVIKSRAGHMSDRMSRHYTHVALSAQRNWMRFVQERRFPPQSETYRADPRIPSWPSYVSRRFG